MRRTFEEGVYFIDLGSDDGTRLFIDGNLVIDDFNTMPFMTNQTIQCLNGVHEFVIEYFERGGQSRVQFTYEILEIVQPATPVSVCNGATFDLTTIPLMGSPDNTGTFTFADGTGGGRVAGTDFDPTGLPAPSTYPIALTYDIGACDVVRDTIVLDILDAPSLVIGAPAELCSGSSLDLSTLTGGFTVSPMGGTFSFSNASNGNLTGSVFDATGLTSADSPVTVDVTYSVTGCTDAVETLTINILDAPSLVIGAPAELCSGSSLDLSTLTGGFTVSPMGGTFSFSNASNGNLTGSVFDATGLTSADSPVTVDVTYSVTGCTDAVETLTINILDAPSLVIGAPAELCSGSSLDLSTLTGGFTVSPMGGTFSFSNASNGNLTGSVFDATGLTSADSPVTVDVTYSVTGCTDAVETLTINILDAPSLVIGAPAELCSGSSLDLSTLTGGFTVSPMGGTFSFSNASNGNLTGSVFDATGLTSADSPVTVDVTYSVTGCTDAVETLTINILDAPSLVIGAPAELCSGSSLDLSTLTGGFTVSPMGGTFSFSNASNGNLTGSVFDATGLTSADSPVTVDVTYSVTGCTDAVETLTINILDAPSLVIGAPAELCSGSSLDLSTLTGGFTVSPMGGTFSFSNASNGNLTGSVFDATGLTSADSPVTVDVTYSVTGCTDAVETLTINILDAPTVAFNVTNSNTLLCTFENLTVNLDGSETGITYQIFIDGVAIGASSVGDGNAISIVAAAGTFGSGTVTVQAINGSCPDVLQNGSFTVNFRSATDPLCGGGGGMDCFAFGVQVINIVRPTCGNDDGSFDIVITSNGTGVNFNSPQLGTRSIISGTSIDTLRFTELQEDTYVYSLTDGSGNFCPDTENFVELINEPSVEAELVAGSTVNPLCFGDNLGIVTIFAEGSSTGDFFYSINGVDWFEFIPPANNTTITNNIDSLPANGTFTIFLGEIPNDPCPALVDVTIESTNPEIVFDETNFQITPVTVCDADNGEIRSISPPVGGDGGPYQISINGETPVDFNTFVSPPLPFGPATLTVIDGTNECASSIQVNVPGPNMVMIDTTTIIPSCIDLTQDFRGLEVQILNAGSIPGNYELLIEEVSNPGNRIVVVQDNNFAGPDTTVSLLEGIYDVRVTPLDPLFCFDEITNINLTGGGPVPISFDVSAESAICQGGTGSLFIDNLIAADTTYSLEVLRAIDGTVVFPARDFISTSFRIPFDFPADDYVVRITQRQSICDSDFTFTSDPPVTIEQPANAELITFNSEGVDALCNGESGSVVFSNISPIDSSSPIILEVFNDSRTMLIDADTTFSDSVSFSSDLFVFGTYEVRIRQELTICPSSIVSEFQTVNIGQPSRPLSAELVFAEPEDAVSLPDQPTGRVILTNVEGGTTPYVAFLDLTNPFFSSQEDFREDTVRVQEGSIIFQITYENLFAGDYDLDVVDANGCDISLPFTIQNDTTVFVPNVFTPNGDGVNDVFFIRNLPDEGTEVLITNRWGRPIFESSDYRCTDLNVCDWGGEGTPDGVYFYTVRLPETGETMTGWVEIVGSTQN